MRVTSDELGVVAFVLPDCANVEFELHSWPDGSFSLEPVEQPFPASDLTPVSVLEPRHPAVPTVLPVPAVPAWSDIFDDDWPETPSSASA